MAELASCSNVFVKLGGSGSPRCGFGRHGQDRTPGSTELVEAIGPFYRFCMETFRANLYMFESNFPVDKASYAYSVIWNAFERVCKDCYPEERFALFHDTVVKVYPIGHHSWT